MIKTLWDIFSKMCMRPWIRILRFLWTNQQQPTNNQQPTTNNQQPTTNNHQPTTNNQQPPTTNNQPPTPNPNTCLGTAILFDSKDAMGAFDSKAPRAAGKCRQSEPPRQDQAAGPRVARRRGGRSLRVVQTSNTLSGYPIRVPY